MLNLRMKEMVESKEAIDVSSCGRTPEGHYVLTSFVEDVDYCDAKLERWIWSIGRNRTTGQILASTSSEFYEHPDFECLFLR